MEKSREMSSKEKSIKKGLIRKEVARIEGKKQAR